MKNKIIIINCDEFTYNNLAFNSKDYVSLIEDLEKRKYKKSNLYNESIVLYQSSESFGEESLSNYGIRIIQKEQQGIFPSVKKSYFLKKPFTLLLNITISAGKSYEEKKYFINEPNLLYSDNNFKIYDCGIFLEKLPVSDKEGPFRNSEFSRISEQIKNPSTLQNFLLEEDSKLLFLGLS